jgi:hypothetical protein
MAGVLVAPLLALASGSSPAGTLTDQLADAVRESTVNFGFRYRFEAVDEDAFAKEAWASTLRSRVTAGTKPVGGFGLLVEVDDVRHIGADNFNDTRNGVSDRPGVTDPEGTDLNQALLRYTGSAGTELVLGRQRLERANQRFVGGVGWRQNEQTFDAVGVSHKFGNGLHASYAWVGQVNRIQGPDDGTPPADLDSNSHLLDASWSAGPVATLSAYGYLLDFADADALSNQTWGVRANGAAEVVAGWKLGYTLEFARQADYGDNPVGYEAGYYLAELGFGSPRVGLKAGWEVLEGDSAPGSAFRTPLATLHAFQGWADKFLTTPDAGVEDLYVAITGKALGADLLVRAHDFSAQTGSADWGTELDFSANWPIGKHYAVLLKGATYDADQLATDTNKYWLMLTATF